MAKQPRNRKPTPPDPDAPDTGQRIAKVLARAGIASRRGAEELIAQGRISVDGETLTTPAFKVTPDQDIRFDGEAIPAAEPVRLFRYHKPNGLIVTASDPQERTTIFERLPEHLPRVIAIGRLDLTSEGLLLLTTDGGLARTLELPSTGWTRRYRARVHGRPKQAQLDTLAKGIVVDGERFAPIHATLERQNGANAWVTVALKEGKYREVRRALETLELTVNRLIRVAYGPFQLGALKAGEVAEIPPKMLKEQLGSKLS